MVKMKKYDELKKLRKSKRLMMHLSKQEQSQINTNSKKLIALSEEFIRFFPERSPQNEILILCWSDLQCLWGNFTPKVRESFLAAR